jgi:hypothetical protein
MVAKELAQRFGCSHEYVSRLWRGAARVQLPPSEPGAVSASVDSHLATLKLEPAEQIKAETARVLASKLDSLRRSDSAAAAAATPAVVREPSDVVARWAGRRPLTRSTRSSRGLSRGFTLVLERRNGMSSERRRGAAARTERAPRQTTYEPQARLLRLSENAATAPGPLEATYVRI